MPFFFLIECQRACRENVFPHSLFLTWHVLSLAPFRALGLTFFHIFLFWFKFVFHLCRSDKGRMRSSVGKVFSPSFFFPGAFGRIWLVRAATLVKTKFIFSGIPNKQWYIFYFFPYYLLYGMWHWMLPNAVELKYKTVVLRRSVHSHTQEKFWQLCTLNGLQMVCSKVGLLVGFNSINA